MEDRSLELGGRLAATAARALVAGTGLELDTSTEHAEVSVLLLRMRRLRPLRLPFPELDYGEALWRLTVRHRGQLAWLALACDLDEALVRWTGRWLVRYPVRQAELAFEESAGRWRVGVAGASGTVTVEATPGEEEPDAEPPRPLFARSSGALWRIPWDEEPAPWRRRATARLIDEGLARAAFGAAVDWATSATLHRGRIHRCGVAARVS
jgi:hypothetical protein